VTGGTSVRNDFLDWLSDEILLAGINAKSFPEGTEGRGYWNGYRAAMRKAYKQLKESEDRRGHDPKKKR
jgi:hypothetical protein